MRAFHRAAKWIGPWAIVYIVLVFASGSECDVAKGLTGWHYPRWWHPAIASLLAICAWVWWAANEPEPLPRSLRKTKPKPADAEEQAILNELRRAAEGKK